MLQPLLIILLILVSLLYIYLRRNYNYWRNRGVPYEEPNILYGNLSFVMRRSANYYFDKLYKKYPTDYVGIYLGWKPTLVVQSPELVRKVLIQEFDSFANRHVHASRSTDPLGSFNLFTLKDKLWTEMRNEVAPMFTASRLKYVTEIMNNNAKELAMKIKRDHIDGNVPVSLKELFTMYTSDTVGSTAFGIKVSALNDPNNPLWYITKHMTVLSFWRGLELYSIFFLPTLSKILRLKFFSVAASEYIKKLFWSVVKERQASNSMTNDKDFVNFLLKLKSNLKLPAEDADADLADNLMLAQAAVFVFGSIETSSTTLSYLMLELASNPDKQEKLFMEIDEAVKRTGNDTLDYDDLLECRYLSACLLETLRKHTPVCFLDRLCSTRCKLTDDLVIEAGTPVLINLMALHHNPKYFPEPEQWRPERMMDVQENANVGLTFIPFGAGPRYCIGKRYGALQVRAAAAQIVHKFKILPDPAQSSEFIPNPYSVFLSPLNGGKVIFKAR